MELITVVELKGDQGTIELDVSLKESMNIRTITKPGFCSF